MPSVGVLRLFTRVTGHINEVILVADPLGQHRLAAVTLNALYKLLCLFYLLHHLATGLAMRHNYRPFLDHDTLFTYLNHDRIFDANAMFCGSLVFIIFAYFPHVIFVAPDPFFWRLAYDLVVVNGRGFFQLNAQLRCPYRVPLLKQFWEVVKIFKSQRKVRFSSKQLVHFPSLSNRTRTKLHAWTLTLNLANAVYLITLATADIFGYSYHLYCIFLNEPWHQFLVSLLNCACIEFVFRAGFECSLLFVLVYRLLVLVYQKLNQSWQRQLLSLIRRATQQQQHHSLGQILLARTFQQFHAEHHQLTCYIYQISKQVTNKALFILFFCLTAPNVYLLSSLLIRSPSISALNQAVFTTALLGHYIIGLSMVTPLICISTSLHSHRHWLVKMQWTLKEKLLMNKLKVARLYEALNCQKRIGFSVGPLGDVSWKAVFEFYFVYTGLVFFIVGLIRDM